MIPGSNLLKQAFNIIAQQTVIYKKYKGRIVNAIGQYETEYEPPVAIKGSLQPLPRKLYQQYGLDLSKQYIIFYTPIKLQDVMRNTSGDQLIVNGAIYQIESATDWHAIDGWMSVIGVRVTQ